MAERSTLRRTAQRYRRATKKQKARILDEFVETHESLRSLRDTEDHENGAWGSARWPPFSG